MVKKVLNRVRYNYFVSIVARMVCWPLQRLCESVSNQIKMKVWINGANVRYDGLSIAFPKNVGVPFCSNVFWDDVNGFEPDTWRVIKHFLAESTIFVDVGSNIGFYSVLARKMKPELEVYSFEPVPSIFEKNLAIHIHNKLSTENVINAAVGDADGIRKMFLPISRDSIEEETTATLEIDSWQRAGECETFDVKVLMLDALLPLRSSGARVLVKIDVEDFESKVLLGAERLMREAEPIFVCEILPREHGNQETYAAIEANGYVAFGISGEGLVRFGKDDFFGERSFTDFLILPGRIAPSLNYFRHTTLASLRW